MNPPDKKYCYGNLLTRLCPHKSLLLVCLLISSWLTAQQSSVKFTHITNLDGLSQSTVQVMLKDRYGFMWFGTQEGLNRYDGYNFKVYRHQVKDTTSLRRSNVISLHEDRQGILWVGTASGALSMYDRKRDCFIHYKESHGNFTGLSQSSVTAIYDDKQNNFWVGTYWKLNLLNRKTGKITQFGHDSKDDASISSDGINCILEDSKNNLWIGTSGGLNLLNRKTNKFTHYLHHDNDFLSISDNNITAIKEDELGRLWIGTNNGLNLFNRENGSFTRFTNNPADATTLQNNQITAIENAGNGKLWIGTLSALESFDINKKTFTHFYYNPDESTSLARNANIVSLLRDKQGILWVATYQGGINKYDKYLTYFDIYRNHPSDYRSLSFNTITGFAEKPGGDTWITTGGGALNLWERSTGHFQRFNPDPSSKDSLATWGLLCVYQSKKTNYLYIGTYGSGMDRYDPKTRIFKHYTKGDAASHLNNDAVYAIYEDSKGNIWMGTNGGGVNVLNDSTGIITKYVSDPDNQNTPTGNFIRCFYEDKKGRIWVGSSTGLSAYDPAKKIFSRYDFSNTLFESDMIISLYEDKHGNIWVGTLAGGLNLLDPDTKKLTLYTVENGLPDNTINSIIEDDNGYLWLSTNNGISRFDPAKKTFKNSSLYNGIQSFEFSMGAGLKTSKGEILFGGVNGFNSFNPNNLVENSNIPPIVLTDFRIFNKSVKVDKPGSPLKENIGHTRELTLSHEQTIFTIEFAALGFTASEKNQYSFMLEGFDKGWNTGFQRAATYTNLDAGEYTFRVKASNNDGWWSKETILKIVITPPFWKTWWFISLVVIIVASAIYLVYRFRVNAINAHKILLEQQVTERTESLATMTQNERAARHEADQANIELGKKNKELEQFAYVASHDLQEPLRTTSSFVEKFQNQYHGRLDANADKYLAYIVQSTDRMRVLIKDLLDYSRIGAKQNLERIDCKVMLNEVLADLGMAIEDANAHIEVCPLPVVEGYSTELKGLFQNLLLNAVKFRKKDIHPQIKVCVKDSNDHWEFSFADNGIGIDEKYSEKIFVIFQRLHTRAEYQGSGIGLSHCKKIVELHNGKIWVKSAPGEGSTFYFTIPKKIKHETKKAAMPFSDSLLSSN